MKIHAKISHLLHWKLMYYFQKNRYIYIEDNNGSKQVKFIPADQNKEVITIVWRNIG